MTSLGCKKIDGNCEKHGHYEADAIQIGSKEIVGACTLCVKEQQAKEAAASMQQAYDRNFRQAGVPPRYVAKGFDAFRAGTLAQQHALKVCCAYVDKFTERFKQGGGLILCGKPGTGKTHLAVAIVTAAIKQGYQAKFMSLLEAMRSIKSTYSGEGSEEEAIAKLVRPDLLVLDEVGVQFESQTEWVCLNEIINRRYNQIKPTILISNLNIDELTHSLGERVIDRMREGKGVILTFDWQSERH